MLSWSKVIFCREKKRGGGRGSVRRRHFNNILWEITVWTEILNLCSTCVAFFTLPHAPQYWPSFDWSFKVRRWLYAVAVAIFPVRWAMTCRVGVSWLNVYVVCFWRDPCAASIPVAEAMSCERIPWIAVSARLESACLPNIPRGLIHTCACPCLDASPGKTTPVGVVNDVDRGRGTTLARHQIW